MRIESDVIKTTGVLAGAALLFVLIAWLPSRLEAGGLQRRLAAAKTELAQGQEAQQQLAVLRQEVINLENQVNSYDRQVPDDLQMAELMRQISSALHQHDASDLSARNGEEFRGAQYNIVPLTLQFRASFVDLYLFLEQLESMRRLVRVDKLDLDGDRDDPAAKLDVQLQLSAFYAPQEGTQP